MKHTQVFLLLLSMFMNTSSMAQQANSQSNIEKFSSNSGTLIEKEFIPVGSVNKEIKIQVILVSDLISTQRVSGIQVEYKSKYSTNSTSTFLDKDEINAFINALGIIKDQIIVNSPKNYKEVIFSSRSGFRTGCYWDKGKWVSFIQVNKRDSKSYAFITIEELTQLSDQLIKASKKL